jgi:hypothetical protein
VKLEVFYYSCTFFWFNAAIILSDLIFLANVVAMVRHVFNPAVTLPFAFDPSNVYIAQMFLLNWLVMILVYLLQITISQASQFGQATIKQVGIALVSYLTYTQLFIVISVVSVWSVMMDKLLRRDGTKWVKTKRFAG